MDEFDSSAADPATNIDLKQIIEGLIAKVEALSAQGDGSRIPLEADMLRWLNPLRDVLARLDENSLISLNSKVTDSSTISKLKEAVKDIKKQIESLEDFEYSHGKKTFSSKALKDSILPQLEYSERRIEGIENLATQIDSVRNEIINPVRSLIVENEKKNKIVNGAGLVLAIVGIFPPIYSYLHNAFAKSVPANIETSEETSSLSPENSLGGFSYSDLERLKSRDNLNQIDSLRHIFSASLPGKPVSLETAKQIISGIANPNSEELWLLIACFFYTLDDLKYAEDKLLPISDTRLLNDKYWLLSEIYMRDANTGKLLEIPEFGDETWLGIDAAKVERTRHLIYNVKKAKIKVSIFDGSGGIGRKTTEKARLLSTELDKEGWKSVNAYPFEYGKYQLNVSRGAESQIWVKDSSNSALSRFKSDFLSSRKKFNDANANPAYPETFRKLKEELHSDIIILIGI